MDLDRLMKDTAGVPEPAPRVVVAARRTLEDALGEPAHAGPARRGHRGRRGARVGIAVLAVAAAAAAFIAGPSLFLGGRDTGANAGASELLRRAGAAAGAQPGGWPDAAYWHSTALIRGGTNTLDPNGTYTRQIWIGNDRSGVLQDPSVSPGTIPLGVALFPVGSRSVSWAGLYSLSTDPRTLEGELRADINGAGPDDDSELFTIVGDLLRESPAPPALRRALWDVASNILGVSLVGPVIDGAGRSGVAVERAGQRYVVEPTTGRLLEESEPGGMRITYLQQGPVTTAPASTGAFAGAKPAS